MSVFFPLITSDVYIRDNDDRTVQFKARVFKTDVKTETAKLGFYPQRVGEFSEIHLPEIYRAEVPLLELSLTPHGGAEQKGYAEALAASGVPVADLVYMDNAGRMITPGDPVPERPADKTAPVPQVADLPQPDLDGDDAPLHAQASGVRGTSVDGTPDDPALPPAKKAKAKAAPKPQPLFDKQDVLLKLQQMRAEIDKLISVVEGT